VSGGTPGPTSATITWANGGGSARAVFMEAGSSGTPTVSNGTTYSASTTFPTTPGSSWYCVYNGTGTSVTVTNLQPSTQYRAMGVEYNGTSTYTNYDLSSGTTPATGTNNPNNFTTATPTIGTSGSFSALSTTAGTASSSTSITVTGSNLVANVTATAPAGFDISLDNSSWSTSGGNKSITPSSGSIAGQTVYVRLDAGDAINTYSGNVQLTSTSATTVNAAIPTSTVTAPSTTISSLTASAGPTNSSTVNYTATFAASITGLSASDFSVTAGGSVSGASVGTVTGSGTSWTIPVNTGSGDGTVQLVMNSSSGVSPSVSNATAGSPFGGTTVTIDKTAPTINIGSPSVSNTNTGPVSFTVTYADANFNSSTLAPGNITLNGSGATGTIGVTGSGLTRTVTISGITGNGTLGISIAAGTATDLAGNSAPASSASATFTVDNTAPTVVSIARSDSNPISDNVLDYQVTFSEAVSGVDPADFTMVNSGVTTGTISATQVSPTQVNVTIINVNGTGTAQLTLNSSGTGITDAAGNAISGGFSGETYNVDQTAPTVSSITATAPSNANPTNATSVSYTVTFSEPVSGVDQTGFTATTSGVSTTGISVTPVSSSVYTVNVTGISGDGTLRLDLNGSGTGITDAAGNAISGGFTGDVYNIDNAAPLMTTGGFSSNNGTNNKFAKTGDVIHLLMGFNEPVQTPAVTIGGHSVTPTNTAGNTWTATYTVTSGDPDGSNGFDIHVSDIAGNAAEFVSSDPNFDFVTIDNTAPTVTISAPSVASVSNNGSGTVSYTVTYADANFNTSALTTGGITLNSPGTATGTVGVSGSGTSYTVTISGITGAGTLGISVAGGYATDQAGNTDAGAGPSGTFNVLNSDATLSALSLSHGTLAPAFDPGTISYTANEFNGTQTITVTAVTADPNATILINGSISATSGVATGPITLAVGSNTIDIAVTAQDGLTSKTYTVNVTRAPSSNDDLSGLTMNHGVLSPSFTKANTSYTASVTNSITSIEVKAALTDATAVLKIDGQVVSSGVFSQAIPLNVGPNTITVTIKAQNNVSVKTYTIVVTRAPSANDKLALLKVSKGIFGPAFTSTNTSYTDAVGNTISSVTVTPTAADPTATIQVNGTTVTSGTASGPVSVPFGSSTINVTVTAQDGTTSQTYAIAVTRPANNDADLSFLHMSMGRFGWPFDRNVTSYADTVGNDKTTVKVIPTTLDTGAKVTVNGIPVISGTESAPVNLVFGNNTILVKVTAEDGTTTKTYTVTVLRPVYDRDNLTALKVSNGIFGPAFDSGTTSYTDNVGNSISSITVTPTVGNPTATIKVNGLPVSSGTASGAISLAVGTTTINVVVKAQDSIATKTYTITVTRAPGSTDSYQDISVTKPAETPALAEDGIQVHQGISPNGDGLNDFLTIDNISQYPDNKLTIMNRNGQMIYEAKGYDNASKTFDGHSNKNGQMQLPGTYFYQLDYTVNGVTKRKTGFIVLKY